MRSLTSWYIQLTSAHKLFQYLFQNVKATMVDEIGFLYFKAYLALP